ncbi:unnamed protein product, partial [marine sediment metagenome]
YPLIEGEQNKKVLEKIGNLVADSISVIKDLGYLDTNFLSLLPIKIEQGEHKQIYSLVYDKVKAKLTSQELLPTSDGKYTKAGDALLARGKELTEFLNRNDIQELFLKKAWLDRNITDDKTTRELRDYLINELEIIEVDFESFARKITDKFLQTKSDEWMIDFYTRLLGQQSLWSYRGNKSILRTKPIIRLETNEHIAPFNDDSKIQVYLPTETKSEYKTVKHIFNVEAKSQLSSTFETRFDKYLPCVGYHLLIYSFLPRINFQVFQFVSAYFQLLSQLKMASFFLHQTSHKDLQKQNIHWYIQQSIS